jgi:hypothetical protein
MLLVILGAGGIGVSQRLKKVGYTSEKVVARASSPAFAKKFLIVLVSTILTILGIEISLSFLGYSPDYTGVPQIDNGESAAWWVCDEEGCRFDRDIVANEGALDYLDPASNFKNRLAIINPQGYHDSDEFVHSPALDDAYKILILGDSFTWGASADVGLSWVERVEAELKGRQSVIVWNAAIPATGTKQALLSLKSLLPIMQPDLVILGFFTNDFADNLYPLDMYYRTNAGIAILQYSLNENYAPVKIAPDEAFERAFGIPPGNKANPLEFLIRRTRSGSLFFQGVTQLETDIAYYFIQEPYFDPTAPLEFQVGITQDLVAEIQNLAAAAKTEFLVMLIPERNDLGTPGENYQKAISLFNELGISYIEPRAILLERDYAPEPDPHWNNEGHGKVAGFVLEELAILMRK